MPGALSANPVQDQLQFRKYYQKRFSNVKFEDFANGVYAIDPVARQSWRAIEEFPPYEPAIDAGQQLFEQAFKNGSRYRDCFPGNVVGIANEFPKWDHQRVQVITLAMFVND